MIGISPVYMGILTRVKPQRQIGLLQFAFPALLADGFD
jgi:hypothetical protein